MTIDERLDRIEHITAGMAEQARNDREENRQLWRDTQRQIDDLARRTAELAVSTTQLIAQSMQLTTQSIELTRQMGELSVARLSERVEALVSAIGEWMRAHG
jgi:hypothetical protein